MLTRNVAWLAAGLTVLAALSLPQAASAQPAGKPNVLVIVGDDVDYGDSGVHG